MIVHWKMPEQPIKPRKPGPRPRMPTTRQAEEATRREESREWARRAYESGARL